MTDEELNERWRTYGDHRGRPLSEATITVEGPGIFNYIIQDTNGTRWYRNGTAPFEGGTAVYP